jgi:hypothetical protein
MQKRIHGFNRHTEKLLHVDPKKPDR